MVLLILVDALSSQYLTEDNFPFLYKWAKKNTYVKRIHASCGYCERTEVFTGMYPSTSKNFTAIGFLDKDNVYKNTFLLKFMSILEKISKKNTRRLFNIYSKITRKKMLGYFIPFQILNKCGLTEDCKPHDRNDAFIGESIFTTLRKEKKTYTMDLFTALGCTTHMTDSQRIEVAKQIIHQGYDFIPLYIGMIDTIGHKFVDQPDVMRENLRKVDQMIEELIYEAESIPDAQIMVLGDHGMEIVDEVVNVECALDQLPLKRHSEYEYFLDSTILRIWCSNANKKTIVLKLTELLADKGFWIDDKLAETYHIPKDNSRVYGDLIWCANTGKLIYPDFFNKEIDRGMHGYAEPTDRGKGLCVFTGESKEIDEGNLVDVCPTLCHMLKVNVPNLCEGESFIRR